MKEKRTIYLTQEQYDAVKKFDEDGHKDTLNMYANQAYDYGVNDGVSSGIVVAGVSLLITAGAIKIINFISRKKK